MTWSGQTDARKKLYEVFMMKILTRKAFSKVRILALCLVFCALCLMPGHSRIAFAQETDAPVNVRSRVVEVDVLEVADDDVFIDGDIIYIDDFDVEVHIDEGEGEPDEGEDAPGDERRQFRRGERSGDAFPPDARRMMEDEGISPEALIENPELREEFSDRVDRSRRRERGEGSQPGGEPGAGERGRLRGGRAAGGGLERYTSIIVRNNLFLQLGSGGEEKRQSYALTAVISDTSDESSDKAIIEQQGGGASYYLSEGDTFADEIEVLEIEDKKVKLDKSGEEMTLTLGEGTGDRGGRGGGGRRRGGGSGGMRGPGGGERQNGDAPRGGGDFNPDNVPPFARRMLEERGISPEELRNNPELRQRLFREFRSGGGGMPQMRRMEGGRRGRGR